MNRKEFLQSCACSFCACAMFSPPLAAESPPPEAPKPEDWRIQFTKRRYARMLKNLDDRMGSRTLGEVLQQQGEFCATTAEVVTKHAGDLKGFLRAVAQEWNWAISHDPGRGIITIMGPETKECFCPLIDGRYTPKSACECSLGWNRRAFEVVTGRKVEAKLTESVLRGGRRCSFVIHVTDAAAG